ncbi:MAG: hypothetical protein H0W04_00785, partial [Chthoniobacterales bacterium]|nr:hypothetical protein [Chthoniobacterales bacterium]
DRIKDAITSIGFGLIDQAQQLAQPAFASDWSKRYQHSGPRLEEVERSAFWLGQWALVC